MADIFISYARENRLAAEQLAGRLGDLGWSVWWDRRIPVGRRFEQVIEEQLTAARCVIALWSSHSVASPWVREEAAHGRDRDILAPVLLETVSLPFGFSSIHAADLRNWKGDPDHAGFRDLVYDLTASLGSPQQATAATPEAVEPPVSGVGAGGPAQPERPSAGQDGGSTVGGKRTIRTKLDVAVALVVGLLGGGAVLVGLLMTIEDRSEIFEWWRDKVAIDILQMEEPPPTRVSPEIFGEYYALVIGNDEYAAYGSSLSNARFDARTVADVLKKKYGYKVTLLNNAMREDILVALNVLKTQLKDMDNLLIYYAGHGQIDGGTCYWLPVDAEPAPQTSNWISNDDITSILRDMKAKHVLVVADSCYGGSLDTASRPLSAPPDEKLRVDWIKTLAKKRTRMVMTSGSLSPVLDGGSGGHSVFATALLEVLGTNDDIIEGGRVYLQVAARVSDAVKALGHKQTPVYRSLELGNFEGSDYFFVPSSALIY